MSHQGTNGPGTGPPFTAQGGFVAPPPPPWQQPPPRNRYGWIVAVVAVTALLSAALGAGIGAAVGSKTSDNASNSREGGASTTPPNPSAADTHAQDVALCTKYAIINSAIPKPYDNAMDLLPAAAGLQGALGENADASIAVRAAISDVISAYYARMAAFGEVRQRGSAEPPSSSRSEAQAAYDHAWTTCGLDQ
ncbi:MAG: hypothetical protein K0U78_21210 [Actinomycetia bacterium]|nr:hypothetical protein [Actinomycetes bacterium]